MAKAGINHQPNRYIKKIANSTHRIKLAMNEIMLSTPFVKQTLHINIAELQAIEMSAMT